MKKKKLPGSGLRNQKALITIVALAAFPLASLVAQNDRPAVARPLQANPDEAKEREDLIKAAQDRLKKLKGEPTAPTTITDQASGRETTVRARPTATPAGPAPRPEAPKPAAPLAPKPAAAGGPPAGTAVSTVNRPPVPDPVPLAAAPGNVPPPVPLKPRYDKDQKAAGGDEAVEILANESILDEANNMATFKGDVVVTNVGSVIKSEHLEVFMNDKNNPQVGPDGKEPPFKNAIATGAMVTIEQRVIENGAQVVQIAKARKAEFDGLTGDTILTGGPPFLQKGDQVIRPEDVNAKIILKSTGEHQVIGRSKAVFKVKGGAAGSKGPGLGGSLESITKQRDR